MALCIVILSLFNTLVVKSTTYYVNPSHMEYASTSNGLSWNAPFTKLSSALEVSNTGDSIWLKGQETYVADLGTTDRTNCFLVNEGVQIFGGFTGSETQIQQRPSDKDEYESIISGNLVDTDNCYHVLRFTTSITLDRVIISDGRADFEYIDWDTRPLLDGFGGALIPAANTAIQWVVLRQVTFRDNMALNGGALWFGDGIVSISDCIFDNNTAINGKYEGGYGGSIYAYDSADISIKSSIFTENTAEFRGGAIYLDYGVGFTCDTCDLEHNTARGYGGAIFAENRRNPRGTKPNIISCEFVSNNATIYGGAMCNFNGIEVGDTFTKYEENTASIGGAFALITQSNRSSIGVLNSGNIARVDESTHDEYFEAETLYTSVHVSTEYDSLDIMTDLWQQYTTNKDQIDLRSFDTNDDLCFVDIANDGVSNTNGLSWQTAHGDIQHCLDQLEYHFTGAEIWVAQGIYVPTIIPWYKSNQGLNRAIDRSFEMHANIRMYGGFKGDEESRDDRDFDAYRTVLSGEINFFRVINLLIAAQDVLIDGFIFRDAGCSDLSDQYSGGGIVADGVRFDLVNSVLYKLCANQHGGALYMNQIDGDVIIKNTAFIANTASFNGGALYMQTQTYLYTKWLHFIRNRASRIGGAVFLTDRSYATFEPAEFIDNYALNSGGCVGMEERSNATFDCSHFTNNSARWEGGCLYNGRGTELWTHPRQQWFKLIGTTGLLESNYLLNEGVYDRGQSDVYLWPNTDLIFIKGECGGHKPPSARPSSPPTPATDTIICNPDEPYIASYDGVAITFELIIDRDWNVVIKTCGSTFDTYLFLHDEIGVFIDSCDDCGSIGNPSDCSSTSNNILDVCCSPGGLLQSQLRVDLVAGTYQLKLQHSFKASISSGMYVLDILCSPPGYGDPSSAPTPPMSPYVICNPDTPYIGPYVGQPLQFELINDEDQSVEIQTCFSTFDTFVYLYGSGLNGIHSCDDCGSLTSSIGDCSSTANGILDICCAPGGPLQSRLRMDLLTAGTYQLMIRHAPKAGDVSNGMYVLDIVCTTPSPTPSPQSFYWPTRKVRNRWPTPYPDSLPDECGTRCDGYRVSVDDWSRNDDEVCITYHVQRLVASGYYCYQNIEYLVLGVCAADVSAADEGDFNGLIRSFRQVNGVSSYSSTAYGSMTGIRINLAVEDELAFELCLQDVFVEDMDFSNTIHLRRGYSKFTCDEAWLVGLPCLDKDKFVQGSYGDDGYNKKGKRYKKYYKRKRKRRRHHRAQQETQQMNVTELATKQVVRWEVLSTVICLMLCCGGTCVYCHLLRKKRKGHSIQKIKSHQIEGEEEEDSCDSIQTKGRLLTPNHKYSGVQMEEMSDHSSS